MKSTLEVALYINSLGSATTSCPSLSLPSLLSLLSLISVLTLGYLYFKPPNDYHFPWISFGEPQMHKLWAVRVEGGNGREIYGAGYSDIWAINRLHYKAASPRVCDHVRAAPSYE